LPNIIKIDTYNSELHRFKVGPFLRHSVVVSRYSKSSQCPYDNCHCAGTRWQ